MKCVYMYVLPLLLFGSSVNIASAETTGTLQVTSLNGKVLRQACPPDDPSCLPPPPEECDPTLENCDGTLSPPPEECDPTLETCDGTRPPPPEECDPTLETCDGTRPPPPEECDPTLETCDGTRPPPPEECDPTLETCDGTRPPPPEECDPTLETCDGTRPPPPEECDPTLENCDGTRPPPPEECDPTLETCDGTRPPPPEECDPTLETCDGTLPPPPEECDPTLETCDGTRPPPPEECDPTLETCDGTLPPPPEECDPTLETCDGTRPPPPEECDPTLETCDGTLPPPPCPEDKPACIEGLPEEEALYQYWEEDDLLPQLNNWFDENFDFDDVTDEDIFALGCEEVAELRPEQFKVFGPEVFDAFNETQMDCMPEEVFYELESEEIANMSPKLFDNMRAGHLTSMRPHTIHGMQSEQMRQISPQEFCLMEYEEAVEFLLNAHEDIEDEVLQNFVDNCEQLDLDDTGQLNIPPETRIPARQLFLNSTLQQENIIIDNPVDMTSDLTLGGQASDGGLLADLKRLIAEFGIDVTQNEYGVLILVLEDQVFAARPDPNSIKKAPADAEPGVIVLEDGSFIVTTDELVEIRLRPSLRNPQKVKQAFANAKNSTNFELRVTDTGKTLFRGLDTQATRTGTSIIVNWSYNVYPSGGRSGRGLRADNPLLQSMTFNYDDNTAQQVNAGVLSPDTLVALLLQLSGVTSATEQADGTFKVMFTDISTQQQFEIILYPQFDVQILNLNMTQNLENKLKLGQRDDLIYQVKFDGFGIISRLAIEIKPLAQSE